jgi:hypothetical protein
VMLGLIPRRKKYDEFVINKKCFCSGLESVGWARLPYNSKRHELDLRVVLKTVIL